LLGVGLPLIFLSITAASYDVIPHEKTDQASALINAARNTGGSIGVSLASNVLAHREQFHQSRLVETLIPSNVQYQDTLHQMTNYFLGQGSSLVNAQQQAFQWIGQQVQTQASFLAYMDVFWVLVLVSLVAVPLALALRKVKLGGPAPVAH
jgi:MFS transporter, DHA2 family, multidrug resistance protein